MIELLWKETKENYYRAMCDVAKLFAWLTSELLRLEEIRKETEESIYLQGYTVLWDGAADAPAILLFSNSLDRANQECLLKILQQPPGEFKEKYVACILSQEPDSVNEVKSEKEDNMSDSESEGGVEIEIENKDEET